MTHDPVTRDPVTHDPEPPDHAPDRPPDHAPDRPPDRSHEETAAYEAARAAQGRLGRKRERLRSADRERIAEARDRYAGLAREVVAGLTRTTRASKTGRPREVHPSHVRPMPLPREVRHPAPCVPSGGEADRHGGDGADPGGRRARSSPWSCPAPLSPPTPARTAALGERAEPAAVVGSCQVKAARRQRGPFALPSSHRDHTRLLSSR
ncbi:hypothetical protein F9278_26425 [Streptomyces phaeolivaceus]|uniref:Uncharacterized protein n=1 Tax=Streptomyces phaeolivaceus TaxID=2653200 RepID=A0A5P8K6Z3_9ACTN|nr:hypothetical protein F9278_26425 [Streptomyces phaeolivaceus]